MKYPPPSAGVLWFVNVRKRKPTSKKKKKKKKKGRKLLSNLVLSWNTICNFQKLKMFLDDFFNLVELFLQLCKDFKQRYGRTRTRGFFSTARVVSLIACMLFINLLKHLFLKVSVKSFFKKISFKISNSMCNLVQSEHIQKHLLPSANIELNF